MANRSNLSVPTGWSQQDRRFGESVKQNLDVLVGHRGDKLDRAVTFRDLIDSGVAKLASGITVFDGKSTSVVSTDDIPNLLIPPAPTNLAASGAFENIFLSWDLKTYRGHSGVEIWRHTSDSIANATMVAQVSGFTGVYGDQVGSGASFYYWVRAVNQNGVIGPFNSSTGTQGTTAVNVNFLISALSGAITSSELATSLATPIGNLPANTAQAIADAQADIDAIFTEVPVWSSTAAYSSGQIVRASTGNSKLYIAVAAISANSSIGLDNTSYWKLYGDYESLKTTSDNSAAAILQINNLNSNTTSASAQAVRGLRSAVYANGDPSEGVILASAAAVSQLETEVFGATGSSINASASRIDGLVTEVFNPDGSSKLASATALSTLETEVYGGTSATSSRIDAIDAVLFDSSGNEIVSATNLSTMKSGVLKTDGSLRATADQLNYLNASYTDPVTGEQTATLAESLETSADNVNGLRSQYSVKVSANGYVAGFGLTTTSNNGTPTSAFIVAADSFAIVNATDTTIGQTLNPPSANVPFLVHGGGPLNGVNAPAGVYMKQAFIADGQITSAQIKGLSADKIDAGVLNVTDRINANSISAGKLKIDTNILQEDASTGNLLLVTSNGSNGIKVENLSNDAVGTVFFAESGGYTASANQSQYIDPSDYTAATPWYEAPTPIVVMGSIVGYAGTTTLPQIFSADMSGNKIKESGYYTFDFSATVAGSVSSFGASTDAQLIMGVLEAPSGSSSYSHHTSAKSVLREGGSNVLGSFFTTVTIYLTAGKNYRIRLYGYNRGVNSYGGQLGWIARFVRVFRINKST